MATFTVFPCIRQQEGCWLCVSDRRCCFTHEFIALNMLQRLKQQASMLRMSDTTLLRPDMCPPEEFSPFCASRRKYDHHAIQTGGGTLQMLSRRMNAAAVMHPSPSTHIGPPNQVWERMMSTVFRQGGSLMLLLGSGRSVVWNIPKLPLLDFKIYTAC
jgi:hypothetical protein